MREVGDREADRISYEDIKRAKHTLLKIVMDDRVWRGRRYKTRFRMLRSLVRAYFGISS